MLNNKNSKKAEEEIKAREERERVLSELYKQLNDAKEKIQTAKGQEYNELYQEIDVCREQIDIIEGEELEKIKERLRHLLLKSRRNKVRKNKIKSEEIEKKDIQDKAEVTTKEFLNGKRIEVKNCKNKGNPCMRRYSKTEMIDTRTGEIIECKHNEYKTEEGISRSKRTLRDYITNYFDGGINQIWYTATYKGEQASREVLKKHYDSWRRKLKRKYPNVRCITIPELQERETWHLHTFMLDITGERLFIPKEQLNKMWGKGNVWVERMKQNEVERLINYGAKIDGAEKLKNGENLYFKDQYFKLPNKTKGIQKDVQEDLKKRGYIVNGGKTINVTNEITGKQVNEITTDYYIRQEEDDDKEDKQ